MHTEMDLPLETRHGGGDHGGAAFASWVSVCPRGLWEVQQQRASQRSQQVVSGCGDDASCSSCRCPRMGSLCRVRVRLKADAAEAESLGAEKSHEGCWAVEGAAAAVAAAAEAFPRRPDSVLQVPLGAWTTLRLGEGQCDVTEACVEGMRAGEKCEIVISPLGDGPDVSVCHPAEESLPLCATVELQAFTPGEESWEMSPGDKWEWVKSHKERGGARFKSGDVWGAADSYSRALKLLITLRDASKRETEERGDGGGGGDGDGDKSPRLPSAREFRTAKAELHSNLSLCQLRLKQPERAKASAAKATRLEPGGAKAWYRLGQACQTVNELEEAKRAFRKLLELQPDSPAALKALKSIASRERETNAQLGLRLSKMFS